MLRAEITVEASFIIPLFIMIICAFLYESLLVCDRGTINMTVDRVFQEKTAGDCEVWNDAAVSEILKDKLEGWLILYSVDRIDVNESGNTTEIHVTASPVISLGLISRFAHNYRNYEVTRKVKVEDVCDAVRRIDIVRNDSQ